MLKHIRLQNFQIHKNTELDFTNGLNVIAGSSDNGKSSIIRAIRWTIANRPSGFAFHTHGTTNDTEVTLQFDNTAVTRFKGLKNSGGYKCQGKTFAALRTDVPPEIQHVLNVGDINLQSQHDPYFLLQDSPGEVAKKLNWVSGLSIIGETIQNANAFVKHRKDEVGTYLQQISRCKDELSKTEWAEHHKEDVEGLKHDINISHELGKRVQRLNSILVELQKATADKERYTALYDKYNPIAAACVDTAHQYTEQKQRITTLYNIIRSIEKEQTTVVKAAKASTLSCSCERIYEMVESHKKLKTDADRLKNMVAALERAVHDVWTISKTMKACSDRLAEYKRDNPLCPVCGKPWEEK